MQDADLLINCPRAARAADGGAGIFVVVSGLLALLLSSLELALHSTLLCLQVGSSTAAELLGT